MAKQYISVDKDTKNCEEQVKLNNSGNQFTGQLNTLVGSETKNIKEVFIAKILVNGVEAIPTIDSTTGTLVVNIETGTTPEPPPEEPSDDPIVYTNSYAFEDKLSNEEIINMSSNEIRQEFDKNTGLPEQIVVNNVTQMVLFAPSQYAIEEAETKHGLPFNPTLIKDSENDPIQKTINGTTYFAWKIQTIESFSDTIIFTWNN